MLSWILAFTLSIVVDDLTSRVSCESWLMVCVPLQRQILRQKLCCSWRRWECQVDQWVDQSVWKLQMHLKKETYLGFAWNTCEIPMTPQLWVWYSHRYEFPKPYPYPLMSLVPWYGFICFYFCISSISALMLTCYNAWYWHDALHLVMPRRWTSDLWLDQSLGWPGQCILHTLQYMSQSFSLSKVSLVPYPLSLFLICILYFVICFWAVSQMSADTLDTC